MPTSKWATPCRCKNIPVGTVIHNIECKPGRGGQLVRAAGAEAQLLGKEGDMAIVRLTSEKCVYPHANAGPRSVKWERGT